MTTLRTFAAGLALIGLSGCAGGPSPSALPASVDVERTPMADGWTKLVPTACAMVEGAPVLTRTCSGRIDLTGDGALEVLAYTYVDRQPARIMVRQAGADGRLLFEDEGYALLERRGAGSIAIAAFGDGATDEFRAGAVHRWRGNAFRPE